MDRKRTDVESGRDRRKHTDGRARGSSEGRALTGEELESILLSDLEGLYQAEAAKLMRISRATYARLVFSARRKIAESLYRGCQVAVSGGMDGAIVEGLKCPIHRNRRRGGRLCLCGGEKKDGR